MKKVRLADLRAEQAIFLVNLANEFKGQGFEIPVYAKDDNGDFALVEGAVLYHKGNKKFETEAPAGLYRGGAMALVKTRYGTLVVADERYNWFKAFAGIAHLDEGHDLTLTAYRELVEEGFIFSLDKKTRFVPEGFSKASKGTGLAFSVETITEVGQTIFLGHEINEKNRALEAVIEWNISQLNNFSVNSDEDWFLGGHSGIVVCAMDDRGNLTGYFSGQQGFIPFPSFGVHPTLAKYLGK